MRNPITPPPTSLFAQSKEAKLTEFLKNSPILVFSETGLNNIARRFGVSRAQLAQAIVDVETLEGKAK